MNKTLISQLVFLAVVVPLAAGLHWQNSNAEYLGIALTWGVVILGFVGIFTMMLATHMVTEGETDNASIIKSVYDYYTKRKAKTFLAKSFGWLQSAIIFALLSINAAVFTAVTYLCVCLLAVACNAYIVIKMDDLHSKKSPEGGA